MVPAPTVCLSWAAAGPTPAACSPAPPFLAPQPSNTAIDKAQSNSRSPYPTLTTFALIYSSVGLTMARWGCNITPWCQFKLAVPFPITQESSTTACPFAIVDPCSGSWSPWYPPASPLPFLVLYSSSQRLTGCWSTVSADIMSRGGEE